MNPASTPPDADAGGRAGRPGPAWSTAADLRAQVQRLWERGRLLASPGGDDDAVFPLRLVLKSPSSGELAERFDEVRRWARALQQEATGCRLVMRSFNHRLFGANALPAQAWLESRADALRFVGATAAGQRFDALAALTRGRRPALLAWVQAQPLRALALDAQWERLLDVVDWLDAHPRPDVYLRQVDLPGVHSKFIEEHAAVLGELVDLALPAHAVDAAATGTAKFARRYGFRTKPQRVRFRMLEPGRSLLGSGAGEDLTVDQACFARLAPPAARVFMTENEINFLAFPALADALVVFGGGYGFDMLAQAHWLHGRRIHYWGDIDTHGFAILDQLRARFAHVDSFLMDRATLLAHRAHWSDEPQPALHDLARLDAAERALFDDLRWRRLEDRPIRLEQERIGFHCVERALGAL